MTTGEYIVEKTKWIVIWSKNEKKKKKATFVKNSWHFLITYANSTLHESVVYLLSSFLFFLFSLSTNQPTNQPTARILFIAIIERRERNKRRKQSKKRCASSSFASATISRRHQIIWMCEDVCVCIRERKKKRKKRDNWTVVANEPTGV